MVDPFARSKLSSFGRQVLDCLAVERETPYTEEQLYDAVLRHTSTEYETVRYAYCEMDLNPHEKHRLELVLWFRDKPDDLRLAEIARSDAILWDDYLTWIESVVAFRLMEITPPPLHDLGLEDGDEDDWGEWEEED